MFAKVSEWVDDVLENAMEKGIPYKVTTFGFNTKNL